MTLAGTGLARSSSHLARYFEQRLIKGIKPSGADDLILAPGLEYHVLIKWGDAISASDTFGFNNDFTAFIPKKGNPRDGFLWVNHEYIDPVFVSGHVGGSTKTLEQVEIEQYNVGGSILRVRFERGQWRVVYNDPVNRRIHGQTRIPFNWPHEIYGSDHAIGTLANCSGGVTPWGTILTCEENYDQCYGERDEKTGRRVFPAGDSQWPEYFDYPPEHYGWVVEVDPATGSAQKHVALGRCAHECATMKELPDGRVVVYTGDDAVDQCLYKFVSSKPGSLAFGTLYVANVLLGQWMPLVHHHSPVLQRFFKDQTDVLVNLRKAARLIGGTPLDRPEDIDIDPLTGDVMVALTNNVPRGNYFGSILKISEADGDHASLKFIPDTYLAGGEETGFACPDNMAFDRAGNLWFTSDISGSLMHREPYAAFKNNGLFLVPRTGKQAGQVLQMASAPRDAELTGPWFAPDGETLFLSVQHPGEMTTSLDAMTSHWPEGGDAMPKPSVVAIGGKTLRDITSVGT